MASTWQGLAALILALASASVSHAYYGEPMYAEGCWNGLPPAFGGTSILSCNHYDRIRPGLTECVYRTVESVVAKKMHEDPTNGGPLLRLHFHDCFVNGCDGSVLLDSSYGRPKGTAEKDADINLTLDAFDIIDEVKAAIDATCSPDVSCADILAVVAAYVVQNRGGPKYTVPLGRLDGCTSQKDVAGNFLPSAKATVRSVYNGAIHSLWDIFQVQGLNMEDLVALSGAHTIGQAHCASFKDRICYDGQSTPEPLDRRLQDKLVNCCVHNKPGTCSGNIKASKPTDTPQMDLEAGNPQQAKSYPPSGGGLTFDNSYFKNLQQRMGLLTSDQALYSDPESAYLVDLYARDQGAFFNAFVRSMIRMGNILPSNMGVGPGGGMQLCHMNAAQTPYSSNTYSYNHGFGYGARKLAQYGVCPSNPQPGMPAPVPSCLAYQMNKFGARKGKCSVPAPSCHV